MAASCSEDLRKVCSRAPDFRPPPHPAWMRPLPRRPCGRRPGPASAITACSPRPDFPARSHTRYAASREGESPNWAEGSGPSAYMNAQKPSRCRKPAQPRRGMQAPEELPHHHRTETSPSVWAWLGLKKKTAAWQCRPAFNETGFRPPPCLLYPASEPSRRGPPLPAAHHGFFGQWACGHLYEPQ